jgi:hypothetical protein
MNFRDLEKERYNSIKADLWPSAAQAGTYRGKPRAFCLADGHAAENLHFYLSRKPFGSYSNSCTTCNA